MGAVRIVAVGRPGSDVATAIASFEQRAARYWRFSALEVRGARAPSAGKDVPTLEWERLRGACRLAHLVVCDERGRSFGSRAFAEWLDEAARSQDVAFVVGGASGLPAAARDDAGDVLSLAPWTLSHDLARLVLVEQVYRAGTILRREPYHRD